VRVRRIVDAVRAGRLPGRIGPYIRSGPVSLTWGGDRGTPIDRWYIERFLDSHRQDITGRALEVKTDDYVRRFGSNLTQVDIVDVNADNPRATFVADIADADVLPDASFDCFVLTQVIHYIDDPRRAIAHCRRILRPGGVLLLTAPALNKIDNPPQDHWRLTVAGCRSILREYFEEDEIEVEGYGNCLVAMAFLTGLAAHELRPHELEQVDPAYPIVICARAVRR
jgi:SAM-dependent methyltransferase